MRVDSGNVVAQPPCKLRAFGLPKRMVVLLGAVALLAACGSSDASKSTDQRDPRWDDVAGIGYADGIEAISVIAARQATSGDMASEVFLFHIKFRMESGKGVGENGIKDVHTIPLPDQTFEMRFNTIAGVCESFYRPNREGVCKIAGSLFELGKGNMFVATRKGDTWSIDQLPTCITWAEPTFAEAPTSDKLFRLHGR